MHGSLVLIGFNLFSVRVLIDSRNDVDQVLDLRKTYHRGTHTRAKTAWGWFSRRRCARWDRSEHVGTQASAKHSRVACSNTAVAIPVAGSRFATLRIPVRGVRQERRHSECTWKPCRQERAHAHAPQNQAPATRTCVQHCEQNGSARSVRTHASHTEQETQNRGAIKTPRRKGHTEQM
jgi:hypothetical protein